MRKYVIYTVYICLCMFTRVCVCARARVCSRLAQYRTIAHKPKSITFMKVFRFCQYKMRTVWNLQQQTSHDVCLGRQLLIQLYTGYYLLVRFHSQTLLLNTCFPLLFYMLCPLDCYWCSHTNITTNYEALCIAIFSIHLSVQQHHWNIPSE
jgi:hypothetical protein